MESNEPLRAVLKESISRKRKISPNAEHESTNVSGEDGQGGCSVSDQSLLEHMEMNSPAVRQRSQSIAEAVQNPLVYLVEEEEEEEEEQKVFMTDMPDEVLERILSPLPILDLLFVVNRVNRRLNRLISDPKFVPWKKLYFKYLRSAKCPSVHEEIESILNNSVQGLGQTDQNLPALLQFIHVNFKKVPNQKQLSEFQRRLSQHRMHKAAAQFVDGHIWPALGQRPSIWVYFAVTLLLCPDALDAIGLIRWLVRPPTLLNLSEIIDCGFLLALLTSIAYRTLRMDGNEQDVIVHMEDDEGDAEVIWFTPAFRTRSTTRLSPRIHYMLASALYLVENQGGKGYQDLISIAQEKLKNSLTGRRGPSHQIALHPFLEEANRCSTESKRQLTFEQLRIIHNDMLPDDCVHIIAYAGTGKTTTLLEYVRARPDMRFLVLMFNRSVCDEAARNFPPNASCMTTHSLAYQHKVVRRDGEVLTLGKRYGGHLYPLKTQAVADVLKDLKDYSRYVRAKSVIQTVESFLASVDGEISMEHVPVFERSAKKKMGNEWVQIDERKKRQYLADARHVWSLMKDPWNRKVPITHDGYLKLYQLESPQILRPDGTEYDAILVDEAQDMNPATLDVIRKQTAPKMFVGDPNQQIYSFRGAINAFQHIKDDTTKTFYLTQSFRFGPEIAFIANCWLDIVKKQSGRMLIGSEKKASVDGRPYQRGPICVIARMNATVFEYCATIVQSMSDKSVSIIGGLERFLFDDLLDIHQLMLPANERKEIKNNLFKKFAKWSNLNDFAEKTLDDELQANIQTVVKYGSKIPVLIEKIRERHVKKMSDASYILTTVHKAKGMEFDTVWLASDFVSFDNIRMHERNATHSSRGRHDECNLMYVAMTRAKHSLVLNSTLFAFMAEQANDKFLRITSAKECEDMAKICGSCSQPFSESELVLCRQKMIEPVDLQPVEVREGVWCGQCVCDFSKQLMCVRTPQNDPVPASVRVFNDEPDINRHWIKPLFSSCADADDSQN